MLAVIVAGALAAPVAYITTRPVNGGTAIHVGTVLDRITLHGKVRSVQANDTIEIK